MFAVLLGAAPAAASSVLETVGAPGAGNGFAARAQAHGTEVAYFNPASLPEVTADLSFGLLWLGLWGQIHPAPRPVGVNVPESIYAADLVHSLGMGSELWPQATSQLQRPRRETRVCDVTPYLALGVAHPLLDATRLVFGLYVVVPATGFLQQDSFFPDEREQFFSNRLYFELLGDRLRVPTIAASLGGRLSARLSWGFGLDVGMATRTRMEVYVPNAADQSHLLIVPEIDTHLAVSPIFGLKVSPGERWWLTATLHAERSWDTRGENRLRFWDYPYPEGESAVLQTYELTQGAEPLRIALGASRSGQLGRTEWRLGAQGGWTDWSRYRDRHGERPAEAWRDTVTVGLGWSVRRRERELTGELGVAPSPVPEQSGRSNYVDSDRWGVSVGVGLPLRWHTARYVLGLQLQGQLMSPRTHEKRADASHPVHDELPDGAVDRLRGAPLPGAAGLQTNNPGYPGFTSLGTMLGASVSLASQRQRRAALPAVRGLSRSAPRR